MFSRIFSRKRRDDGIASSLYGVIVAQARTPALYADIGVPDSVTGRFEMLLLHVALVTRRLSIGSETTRSVGQGVFDLFCRDMDNSLRELGVSDLKVPKHMRRVGEAYYGRAAAYEPGLASRSVEALASAIGRTVFPDDDRPDPARALAEYALAAADRLTAQAEKEIVEGQPQFPEAGSFALSGAVQ